MNQNTIHSSWEIGGAPIGYTSYMNEIRDEEGNLLESWVENVSNTPYVAAFQTWEGGMSRMVTGEANVQLFIENAKDSFAKLHLFIDEETANECHEKEWHALMDWNVILNK